MRQFNICITNFFMTIQNRVNFVWLATHCNVRNLVVQNYSLPGSVQTVPLSLWDYKSLYTADRENKQYTRYTIRIPLVSQSLGSISKIDIYTVYEYIYSIYTIYSLSLIYLWHLASQLLFHIMLPNDTTSLVITIS